MTEIDKNYARAFNTPAGRAVLKHLRHITIERTFGANVTNEEMRWTVAQSALVHMIEGAISRGEKNE